MRGLPNRLLITVLIFLMPVSASAQFVSLEEAKRQTAFEEQSQVETYLTDISSKGASASRQVQAVLAEAGNGRTGITATSRKIDTIVGRLKSDLNVIINQAAKKGLAGAPMRSIHSAAQAELNAIRRLAGETLDQLGFDKAADPKQLTGKYRRYQEKVKEIVADALKKADSRLEDPGRRDTVVTELEKIVAEAEKRIDIATTAFLASNPDVLSSALARIKKTELDALAEAMASRFKTAKARSNDKVNDLNADELAALEEAKKEMDGLVQRSIATIEGTMQQVASSNLPTSSNVAGVNPLLKAKFQAVEQVRQIRTSTEERLKRIETRFMARDDMGALAKEVFQREYKRSLASLTDVIDEQQAYFTAGDPTKKQYQKRKANLQEATEVCDSLFCTAGRLVTGVGSLILSKETGGLVNIAPQTLNRGLGIKDGPTFNGGANPYRGAYSSRFGAGAGGGTGCFSSRPSRSRVAFGLVEVAKAQGGADEYLSDGDRSSDTRSTTGTNGGNFDSDANQQYDRRTGPGYSTYANRSRSQSSSIFSKASSYLNKISRDPFYGPQFSQYFNGTINRGAYSNYYGTPGFNPNAPYPGSNPNCFGQRYGGFSSQYGYGGYGGGLGSPYGGLPGYGNVYNSPFGGLPVGQTLGFGTNNLTLNSLDPNNAAGQLAQGLEMMISAQLIGQEHHRAYIEAIKILRNPSLPLEVKQNEVIRILRPTGFFVLSSEADKSRGIASLFINLCARTVRGGTDLIALCRDKIFTVSSSLPLFPLSSVTTPSYFPARAYPQNQTPPIDLSPLLVSGGSTNNSTIADLSSPSIAEINDAFVQYQGAMRLITTELNILINTNNIASCNNRLVYDKATEYLRIITYIKDKSIKLDSATIGALNDLNNSVTRYRDEFCYNYTGIDSTKLFKRP